MKKNIILSLGVFLISFLGHAQNPYKDTTTVRYGDSLLMEKVSPQGNNYKLREKLPNGVVIVTDDKLDTLIIAHVIDSVLNGSFVRYDSTGPIQYGTYLKGEEFGIFVEKLFMKDNWYYNIFYFDTINPSYLQVEW